MSSLAPPDSGGIRSGKVLGEEKSFIVIICSALQKPIWHHEVITNLKTCGRLLDLFTLPKYGNKSQIFLQLSHDRISQESPNHPACGFLILIIWSLSSSLLSVSHTYE